MGDLVVSGCVTEKSKRDQAADSALMSAEIAFFAQFQA